MHSPFIPLRVDGTKIDNVEEVDLKASGTCIQMTVITHGEHAVCVAEDGKVIKVPVALLPIEKLVDTNGAVIADPGGGMFISDPKKSTGGYVLAHAATIRLIFRKGKGDQVHSLDAVCAQRHKI